MNQCVGPYELVQPRSADGVSTGKVCDIGVAMVSSGRDVTPDGGAGLAARRSLSYVFCLLPLVPPSSSGVEVCPLTAVWEQSTPETDTSMMRQLTVVTVGSWIGLVSGLRFSHWGEVVSMN